jgi:hypothetical protein
MAIDDGYVSSVLVWFEDSAEGRAALARARELAQEWLARLTVVTVATHERVVGCGRCLQGTVLWNLEMKKIAHEELLAARRILDGDDDVSYQLLVGDPADVITDAGLRTGAQVIVLPWHRESRLSPPNLRHVADHVGAEGSWRVVVVGAEQGSRSRRARHRGDVPTRAGSPSGY